MLECTTVSSLCRYHSCRTRFRRTWAWSPSFKWSSEAAVRNSTSFADENFVNLPIEVVIHFSNSMTGKFAGWLRRDKVRCSKRSFGSPDFSKGGAGESSTGGNLNESCVGAQNERPRCSSSFPNCEISLKFRRLADSRFVRLNPMSGADASEKPHTDAMHASLQIAPVSRVGCILHV